MSSAGGHARKVGQLDKNLCLMKKRNQKKTVNLNGEYPDQLYIKYGIEDNWNF